MVNNPPLSSIDKPLISLRALREDTLGLIILRASGVVYTNQTGGTLCPHPSAEGLFMPIGTARQHAALASIFGDGWSASIDELVSAEIDQVLSGNAETRILSVDRTRVNDSHEAWVFVRIASHPDRFPSLPIMGNSELCADAGSPANRRLSLIFGFGPSTGILTWTNSD
jgi:hypothetical protein